MEASVEHGFPDTTNVFQFKLDIGKWVDLGSVDLEKEKIPVGVPIVYIRSADDLAEDQRCPFDIGEQLREGVCTNNPGGEKREVHAEKEVPR